MSSAKIDNGKFTYDTYVTLDGTYHVTITFDLEHPQVRRLIAAAVRNKSRKSIEAGGALVVKVTP